MPHAVGCLAQAIALVFQQHFATITSAKKAHRRGEILLDGRVTKGLQTCATPSFFSCCAACMSL